MVVDVEVDAVQDALTVKFHGEVLEADQFFGHLSSPVSVCTEKSRRSPRTIVCPRYTHFN